MPRVHCAIQQVHGWSQSWRSVIGYYTCRTKSRTFYRYIFLFDVAITHAYILQKIFCPVSTRTWRSSDHSWQKSWLEITAVVDELVANHPWSPLPLHHFPVKIHDETLKCRNFKRGRCAHCRVSCSRTDTTWFCRECQVWLCHSGDHQADCFLQWHTGRELWDLVYMYFTTPLYPVPF